MHRLLAEGVAMPAGVDLVQHLLDAFEPDRRFPTSLDFLTGSIIRKTRLFLSHKVGAHN